MTGALALAALLSAGASMPRAAEAADQERGGDPSQEKSADRSADKAASEETARSHHEQGRVASSFGRYETAISEYRRAYELKADPSYLYDIAEAYRALGVADRAVFFYRRYLSAHPRPPNRPEVERMISVLEPPPPAALPIPIATIPIESSDPLRLGSGAHVVSDDEKSAIGRWWFWTAVGALAAAGATVAILAATREQPATSNVPTTTLGNARIEF